MKGRKERKECEMKGEGRRERSKRRLKEGEEGISGKKKERRGRMEGRQLEAGKEKRKRWKEGMGGKEKRGEKEKRGNRSGGEGGREQRGWRGPLYAFSGGWGTGDESWGAELAAEWAPTVLFPHLEGEGLSFSTAVQATHSCALCPEPPSTMEH